MKTDTSYPTNTMLLSLLGGAIVGAIVLALTTPKTGREVRNTLKTAARRLTGKSGEPDELDTGTIEALFI
jgi:gas vesicle protein